MTTAVHARWRRVVAAAGLGALAAITHGAFAQDNFPARPIRLLVGFPAGGPTDVPARVVAERLRVSLGQPVVVENKPGASGMLAVQELLTRPRDGHELLVCTYIDPVNPVLYRDPKYRVEDLAPISQIQRAHYLLAVRKGFPAQTLAEFVGHARANPGKVSYGDIGQGSMPFFVAKQLEKTAGITMYGVSYRGTPQVLQDMAGDRLDFFVGPIISTLPLVKSGALRPLGVTSPQRIATEPGIPTLVEQGVAITADAWLGICAASGVPPERIRTLNRHVVDAVASDEFRSTIEKVGNVPTSSSPEAFGRLIQETARTTGALVKELGVRLD
jgi:tripartite-type tricarboxylate transporter receptor subunit TctC